MFAVLAVVASLAASRSGWSISSLGVLDGERRS
jgi:hypothetical protein